MSATPVRQLPASTPETAAYWAACRRHELLVQRCDVCAAHQFYPRLICTSCGSRSLQWVRASGRGTLKSFTIVRQAVSPAYAAEVPYVVALVTLDEGPTMMSRIVDCELERIRIGMPLEVVFQDWPEGATLPMFRPRPQAGHAGVAAITSLD